MALSLDTDQLKTFIAIADTGSFTRAAEKVNKTQSAVSMQIKRLEDLLGRRLFAREGRVSRLTVDGEYLLDYARRIVRMSDEAVMSFTEPEKSGLVRLGTPDDYADRFLPEALARFSDTHPLIQVDVECVDSSCLIEKTLRGELDLSIVTCENAVHGDVIRTEPLVWVTSQRHCTHEAELLPVALSHSGCIWRHMAIEALDKARRDYRIAYASTNSMAIGAAVLSGLAVAAIPEILLRPGMRVLTEAEGFPKMGEFKISMVRAPGALPSAVHALAEHFTDALSQMGRPLMAAE